MFNPSGLGATEDGGGFMKNEPGTSGGAKGGGTKRRNSVAVSLDQIMKLTTKEHGLVIHRQNASTIVVVGRVQSTTETTTKSTFEINDQTGDCIEVHLWKTEDASSENSRNIPVIIENTYVKVFGQVRYYRPKPTIVAFKIEPITDLNEITLHHLEIMANCLVLEKRKNNTLSQRVAPSQSVPSSLPGAPVSAGLPGATGMKEAERLVLQVISSETAWEGISFEDICSSLKTVRKEMIREALDFLSGEGHVYTALDDNHYKATG